ncbi:MAG: family 78 glycoside hydrolase catalytic domain [Candidatus Sumerlaeota bacterium]
MPEKTAKTNLNIQNLRVEYKTNPLGITEKKPRFSWELSSDQRGQKQTAYEIIVASSPELLEKNKGDLWKSNKRRSNHTNQIVYEGKTLQSRQACCWKVRAWDAEGHATDWSEPAFWTMGYLKKNDWKALWIGYDKPRKEAKKTKIKYPRADQVSSAKNGKEGEALLPPARYLRREFSLEKQVKSAFVTASATGIYEMYINGKRVSEDFFKPGWTDYNERIYTHTFDVSQIVKSGENAIGAVLADGWYSGFIGWNGVRDWYGKKLRFLAQLEIEYTDGTSERIETSRNWKASTGPVLEADFLQGELYDAREEKDGWDQAGFDDSDWDRVNITTQMDAKIEAHPGVPVQVYKEYKPKSITEPRKGQYIFDFGTNFAGFTRLKINARRGTKIRIYHGERLNEDGTLYRENLRSARAMDTYICKGGDDEIYEPRFTFHGFQYALVTGLKEKPDKKTLTGVELTSATPEAGSFKTSDKQTNTLYRNICQTQRANFLEVPTDCPQRDERLGWTGDAQIYVRTATYNNDIAAFFTKWLVDLEDAQNEDGAYPSVAPHLDVANFFGVAAWADAGIICPQTIHEVYGDTRVLDEHYSSMKKYMSFLHRYADKHLSPTRFYSKERGHGLWDGFGDWLSIKADTPGQVVSTAYYAKVASMFASIAELLGHDKDAATWSKRFEHIRKAFVKAYVQADGKIEGDTQSAYVLALAFNLLEDEERKQRAGNHLVERLRERGWKLSTGFLGTKDLMGVLTEIGRTDIAYRLIQNNEFPSWGFSIKHGATSIWERWNGWTPEEGFGPVGMNSFAHYSFGAVCEWMFRVMGGIDFLEPGYRRVAIRPRPGGRFKNVDAVYASINGPIECSWKRNKQNFKMTVDIPANVTALIYVPATMKSKVTESGKPAEKAEGLELKLFYGEAAIFEAESGHYEFESSDIEWIEAVK